MIPTISQICSLNSPFEKDIEDYAAAPCNSIELWLGKLEAWLETHSKEDFKQLLAANEVNASVASFQGGILASQGEKRKEAWDLFEQRLELLNTLCVRTLVVACDVMAPITNEDVQRVQVSLKQAAQLASRNDIQLAVECQAKAAFGNNLQTLVALVDEVGSEQLGICLDAFHFYVGPSKVSDLGLLTKENLYHVQLCDIADVPREFAMDANRIMPGDGDAPVDAILRRLNDIEYDGCVSVETMNPQIWQVPARQFGEVAMTSLQQLIASKKSAQ